MGDNDMRDALVSVFTQMAEISDYVASVTAGHRAKLLESGMDEHVADDVAAQFHGYVLRTIMDGPGKADPA